MKYDDEWLRNLFTKKGYGVASSVGGGAPRAVLERPAGNEPLGKVKDKEADTSCYRVRVVSYRRRLLDEDNLAEKYFVDGLRYAGLLPGDSPVRCQITATQEKVRDKKDERTEILIERL